MQVLIEQMNINQLILPLDTILPELTVYLAWKVPTTSVRSLEKMMRILLLLVWGTEIEHKSGKRRLFFCLLDYQRRPRIYRVENSEREYETTFYLHLFYELNVLAILSL